MKSKHPWNRFGRRKPWILIGAPIAAAALVMIPVANTLLALMVFILITNFGMSLFRLPTVLLFGFGFFLIRTPFMLGLVLVLTGICWSCVNVNSLPLVFDHGDEDKSGAYTGLYYVAAQAAAVSGPVLSRAVVEVLGNDYRWLWAVSTLYVLLAWLALVGVKPIIDRTLG